MDRKVAVIGRGLAACCCASLLERSGIAVEHAKAKKHRSPTLLLNGSTLNLLQDVFGLEREHFAGAPVISRRVVLWGENAEPATLPHIGIVADEGELLDSLWSIVEKNVPMAAQGGSSDFVIQSAQEMAATEGTRIRNSFGTRRASPGSVSIRPDAADACWVESVSDGWLFLIPKRDGYGSVIAVGGELEQLFSESRLIANQTLGSPEFGASLPAHPSIFVPLAGPDWLRCGGAAMSFDPICGEGAGNAVREAILAAAVVKRWFEGIQDAPALTAHFEARLLAGFGRHLQACCAFYSSGGHSPWWQEQVVEMQRGISWVKEKLAHAAAPQFRLEGFDLVSIKE